MLPRHIWLINFSGLLCNISTSLMFGLSASFLRTVIGVNPADIGLFQGMIDAMSFGTKLSAGLISDFLQKRRTLIIIGMMLVVMTKPMLAVAGSLSMVFLARALDRFGNGIQATPRDALLGDLCPEESRGRCYGLRNALTVLGSFMGSVLGIQLMYWTGGDFRFIFWLSTIPALAALIFSLFFIPDSFTEKKSEVQQWSWSNLKTFDADFWRFILVAFCFLTFRYNETILVIKSTENLGLSHSLASGIFMVYNLALCACSYPIGILADRFPKERILLFSFFMAMAAHFICGYADNLYLMLLGVVMWGIQMGASNSMLWTLVANYANISLRGTAFSIFFTTCLVATLSGSFIYRFFCQNYGLDMPFFVGTAGVGVASLLLYGLFSNKIHGITQNIKAE
jgi:MFS family permease